jgi:hypothetical protein
MNKFFIFSSLFFSLASQAALIPVDGFDQSKLESVLRKIPESVLKEENHTNFKRKFHEFPATSNAGFKIKCQADYFLEATVPSEKKCQVEVENLTSDTDEVSVTISDEKLVTALRSAFSYGQAVKSFYSTERVQGLSLERKYREIFRYAFVCQEKSCLVTFAKIPSKE